MAIKIITQVWEYPHLRDQSQLLVMLALADFSNDQGQCFPSVATLADKARVSERHAQKIIAHLETYKLISVQQGAGMGRIAGQRTNLFTINLGLLASKEPIPEPEYAKANEGGEGCHHATGRGVTMPPVGVAWETKTRGGRGVTMPPKPSEEEENRQKEPRAHARTHTRIREGSPSQETRSAEGKTIFSLLPNSSVTPAIDTPRPRQPRPLPPSLDTQNFRDWWRRWLEHLEERHSPYTRQGEAINLSRLERAGEPQAVALLQRALEKGWKSIVFDELPRPAASANPPRPSGNGYYGAQTAEEKYFAEREAAAAARRAAGGTP